MKQVKYKGKIYPSLRQLTLLLSLSYDRLYSCLRKGLSITKAIKKLKTDKTNRNAIVYNGVTYSGIIQLSRKLNISKSSLKRRLKLGQSLEDAIYQLKNDMSFFNPNDRRFNGKNSYFIHGNTYPSLKALSLAFKVNQSTLKKRLASGFSLEDSISSILKGERLDYSYKPIIINEIYYRSKKHASNSLNISILDVEAILKNKAVLNNQGLVIRSSVKNGKKVIIDDKQYLALSYAAKDLGVSRYYLAKCLKAGISCSHLIKNRISTADKLQKLRGELYVLTNTKTGRKYIGITLVSARKRFKDHMKKASSNPNSRMYEDYQRFGVNSFKCRVLKKASANELKQLEKFYIQKWNTQNPILGYNKASGGALYEGRKSCDFIKYKGVIYSSLANLCVAFDISLYRTKALLQAGNSLNKAVSEGIRWKSLTRSEQNREVNALRDSTTLLKLDKTTKVSLKHFCQINELSYASVGYRIRNGFTPKQAIRYYAPNLL